MNHAAMKEVTVNAAELPWERPEGDAYPQGIERKVLYRGPQGEPWAALLRLAPGFAMDAHSHLHTEHHYVLEGEYEESADRRFPAGTYRVIAGHATHGPFRSRGGALVLVIWVH